MSVEELAPETYIPGEDEVESSGGNSWRLAKGKFVKGPKEALEEKPVQKIVGIPERFGIHYGETNDQYHRKYVQVEIEFKTRDGVCSVHASLWDSEREEFRPSGSAVSLGRAIVNMAKDPGKAYQLTVSKGDDWTDEKTGKLREGSTYVNLAVVVMREGKPFAEPIRSPKREANAPRTSYTEQWAEIEPIIKASSLYKERDGNGTSKAPTHFSEFCGECAAKGWPTPEQAPNEWLAILAKLVKGEPGPRATLAAWTENEWGNIRQVLKAKTDLPKMLVDVKLKLDAAGGSADPFADDAVDI